MAYDDMNDDQPNSMDAIVSPLRMRGINPDDVRANPQLLAQVMGKAGGQGPAAGLSQVNPSAPTPQTAAAPAPVPAAVSPSGSAQPNIEKQAIQKAYNAVSSIDPQADLAREQTAEEKLQKDSAYINPRDAAGKVLPQYRPSIAQRILRGVQGVQRGGILGAVTAPYGAPNPQYQRDVAQQGATVANDQQSLTEMARRFKEARDAATGVGTEMRGIAAAERASQPSKADEAKPVYNQKTSSIEYRTPAEINAAPPGTYLNEAAAAKLPQTYAAAVVYANTNEKDRNGPLHKAVAEMEKHERSLQPPNQGHTMSKEELWHAAFVRDFKREPTAAEVMSAGVAGAGTAGGAAAKPTIPARGQSREAFEKDWGKRLGPGSALEKKYDAQRTAVTKDDDLSTDEKTAKYQEIEAERESEKQELQAEKDAQAAQYGVYNQPAAKAADSPPDTKTKIQVGQRVSVKGKQYTVGKVYPDGTWDPR